MIVTCLGPIGVNSHRAHTHTTRVKKAAIRASGSWNDLAVFLYDLKHFDLPVRTRYGQYYFYENIC